MQKRTTEQTNRVADALCKVSALRCDLNELAQEFCGSNDADQLLHAIEHLTKVAHRIANAHRRMMTRTEN